MATAHARGVPHAAPRVKCFLLAQCARPRASTLSRRAARAGVPVPSSARAQGMPSPAATQARGGAHAARRRARAPPARSGTRIACGWSSAAGSAPSSRSQSRASAGSRPPRCLRARAMLRCVRDVRLPVQAPINSYLLVDAKTRLGEHVRPLRNVPGCTDAADLQGGLPGRGRLGSWSQVNCRTPLERHTGIRTGTGSASGRRAAHPPCAGRRSCRPAAWTPARSAASRAPHSAPPAPA